MAAIVNQSYGATPALPRPLAAVPVDGAIVTIEIYQGSNIVGTTTADRRGNWRRSFSLDDGSYQIKFIGFHRPVGENFSGQYAKPTNLEVVSISVESEPSEPTGDIGATGPAGPSGPTGPSGPQGLTGEGVTGDTGPQGVTGLQGPTGPGGSGTGGPGVTGDTGPQGEKGDTGDAGSPGAQGDTGDTGPSGSDGITGPTGPVGDACDLEVGTPADGQWDDGLFAWESTTATCEALDNLNEVLASLAPPPAPDLSEISMADTGVTGKISWGASHSVGSYADVSGGLDGSSTLDVNGTFVNNDGQRKGIFNDSTTMNGDLNPNATHAYAYDDGAFTIGDGTAPGTLKLYVNGSLIHSVSLVGDPTGSDLNVNGSGFTSLTAAKSVEFDNGDPFNLFKYKTGSWIVVPADQRDGWNYVHVIHTIGGSDSETNYFEWVVDDDTTAVTYTAENQGSLAMAGSDYLSGVQYHTSGQVNSYSLTLNNLHRNTWKTTNAITHPTSINCGFSPSSEAIDNIAGPNWEAQSQIITPTITLDNVRHLASSISYRTGVDRTVQSDNQQEPATNPGYEILMDPYIAGASGETNSADTFNAEGYRMPSNFSITSTSYSSGAGNGPSVWNSATSMVFSGGSAGYSDGLLVYNGAVRYPTQGANSGDFSTVADGPAGNPDYSGESNDRVYIRYFYNASTYQNFVFNFSVTSTSFVSVATGPSGNNVTAEILAPNTTQDGVGTIEWKDMVTPFTTEDAIGAYASTYGSTIPTDWGVSLGSRSTATSGNAIVIRITASSSWSGSINSVALTWDS